MSRRGRLVRRGDRQRVTARRHPEQGAALMTVLAVILALTTIAAIILSLSGRELLLSVGHRSSREAFYLAEAGGQMARLSLQRLVEIGITNGLHHRSARALADTHRWLRDLVAGSGRIEGSCERAESSTPYRERGGGSDSLRLLEVAEAPGRPGEGLGLGLGSGTQPQTVQLVYRPEGGVFGLAPGSDEIAITHGSGAFTARVLVSRAGNAWAERAFPDCAGAARYVFPFRYTILAEGRAGAARHRISGTGTFSVVVEQPSFGRYAWFNNVFGTRPICDNRQPCRQWVLEQTYGGPVHTNDRLWIAGRPIFEDLVTSANVSDSDADGEIDPSAGDQPGLGLVRFYNGGVGCPDQDAEAGGWCDREVGRNLPADAPRYLAGFERRWHYIATPTRADAIEWAALVERRKSPRERQEIERRAPHPLVITDSDRFNAVGLRGATGTLNSGVFLPTGTDTSSVERCAQRGGYGGRLQGGIYAGQPLEALRFSVDRETSVYELYTDPENHWTIRIDRERNQTHARYERGFARMECSYDGIPNGVIFVNGDVNELSGPPRRRPDDATTAPPFLHRDDALTVAAVGSIRIASDLRYQEDPRGPDGVWSPKPCTGDDRCQAQNVLGLYSVEGDVRLSETSPRNMIVHAVLMAGRGSVDVTAVRQRPFNGTLTILGGKINRYEGLIDTSEKAGREGGGYKLILTYDHRLGRGLLDPPAFPRVPLIGVRAAPGLADRPTWGDRP